MKKQLLYLLGIVIILSKASYAYAKYSPVSNPVKVAINKYKNGNYTGCLQDCQNIVAKDPSNTIAYYYLAMSYVQAGNKDDAIKNYAKVLSITVNPKLQDYASTGKRCLETPDKCHLDTATDSADLDNFIATPNDTLSDTVKDSLNKRNLDNIKNEINNGRDLDNYQFRKFKDYSPKRSQADNENEAIAQEKPSNDQIVAAIKTLQAAGINPYAQTQAQVPQSQDMQAMTGQNAEMQQLKMLMGENNNQDNSMLNMLPVMAAQNKEGASNYSPQLMQAVMMNSMMNSMNFSVDDKDNK